MTIAAFEESLAKLSQNTMFLQTSNLSAPTAGILLCCTGVTGVLWSQVLVIAKPGPAIENYPLWQPGPNWFNLNLAQSCLSLEF